MGFNYRPQTKFAKVIFLRVCHSVHRGRGLPHCMLGYTRSRSPRSRPPWEQTPPSPRSRPPGAVQAGRYGQQAGGTHPTVKIRYYILLVNSSFKFRGSWNACDPHQFQHQLAHRMVLNDLSWPSILASGWSPPTVFCKYLHCVWMVMKGFLRQFCNWRFIQKYVNKDCQHV